MPDPRRNDARGGPGLMPPLMAGLLGALLAAAWAALAGTGWWGLLLACWAGGSISALLAGAGALAAGLPPPQRLRLARVGAPARTPRGGWPLARRLPR